MHYISFGQALWSLSEISRLGLVMQFFLSAIFYVFLITLFQYFQNRDKNFLNYAFCLLGTFAYLLKDHPELTYLFLSEPQQEFIQAHHQCIIDYSEITVFALLVLAYVHFFRGIFEMKSVNEQLNRYVDLGILILFCFLPFDWLFLWLFGKNLIFEVIIKSILASAAPFFMYRVYRRLKSQQATQSKEEETKIFNFVLFGLSSILLAAILTGFIHLISGVRNTYQWILPLGFLVDVFFFYSAVSYKYRLDLIKSTQSDLTLLMAQMDYHAQDNLMQILSTMMLRGEKEKAMEFMAHLSDWQEQVMKFIKLPLISLEEEIDFCQKYTRVYGLALDKFVPVFEYPEDSFWMCEVKIPPFGLQVFVENAMKHGLRHKSKGEKRLLVKVEKQETETEEWIECIIEDNGIGRANAAQYSQSSSKIGLNNIRERFRLVNQTHRKQSILPPLLEDALPHKTDYPGTRVRLGIKRKLAYSTM